jgi:DsbC/DsbD-like thiol-disulfide interchange protein
VGVLAGAMLACVVSAGVRAAPVPVAWTLAAFDVPPTVRPGDRLTVTIRAVVEAGWHLFGTSQAANGPTPLRVSVPAGQVCALAGPVKSPPPHRAWDPLLETETATHDGVVEFSVPLRVAANAAAGRNSIAIQVQYQACSTVLCLPPRTITLSMPLEIRRDSSTPPRQPRSGA